MAEGRKVAAVRAGLGAGLLIAGTGALAAGTWGLPDDVAAPSPGRGSARALVILTWLALLVLAGCRLLAARGRAVRALVPVATAVAALLALGAAAHGAAGLASQYGVGFAGTQTLLVGIGGVATGLGVLLMPAPNARTVLPGRYRSLAAAGAVVGVALVAAVAVPLALGADGWALDSTTAVRTAPAAPPASVSHRAWTYRTHQRVLDVVAAGAGVVVRTEHGVVALDGRTGAQRWHYLRSGSSTEQVTASRDRTVVLVDFATRGNSPERLIGLDATTGHQRFNLSARGGVGLLGPTPLQTTDDVVLGSTGDDEHPGYVARSLRTGDLSWTYRPPAGCSLTGGLNSGQAVPVGLVVFLTCADQAHHSRASYRTVLVQGKDGHVGWQHTVRLADTYDVVTAASSDGDVVSVSYVDAGSANTHGVLLDARTGSVVPGPSDVRIGPHDATIGLGSGLRDLRTRRVLLPPGEPAACATDVSGAVLSASVLCVELAAEEGAGVRGVVNVRGADYGGSAFDRRLTERLGGPFVFSRGSVDSPLLLVAAPGAAVLADTDPPRSGGISLVVGLR